MLENDDFTKWRESVLSSTERFDYCIDPNIQRHFSEIELFQPEQAVSSMKMDRFKHRTTCQRCLVLKQASASIRYFGSTNKLRHRRKGRGVCKDTASPDVAGRL